MEGQALVISTIICVLFCNTGDLCTAAHNGNVVNIGVLLNLNTLVGKVAKITMEMAQAEVNKDTRLLNGGRLALQFNDTRGDPIVGASAALDLLEREVVAIIGPQASEVAEFILHLGQAAQVPIVSFSVTSPLITHEIFPYFVRMAHSDALQMRPIAALAQAYGWRRVTAIYSDDECGSGAVPSLIDALRDVGSELVSISVKSDNEAIEKLLYTLQTMESRVFVVHMQSDLALKVLMKASQIGMMDSGYVWITTDEVTSLWDVLLNDSTKASMQGLLGIKTYIDQNSNKLGDFTRRWRRQFRHENPDEEKAEHNPYGLFAYDSVLMIAGAIGKLGNKSFHFSKSRNPTVENTTDLGQLVKVFQEGPQLLNEILKTNFSGLSGVVQLPDGEIVGSTYEIVNVVGNGYHVVGYWNNETQISKQLPFHALSPSIQNRNIDKLGIVIWPGRPAEVPSGWVQPLRAKKMKIAVPNKSKGFTDFVSVAFDRVTNRSEVTGFCRDVFEAVLSRLNYSLPYDLIPYNYDNYTDLVYQVYLKNFDAVLGDTTILADRSQYVDFTHPFTESGVAMVVPIKAGEANNAWAFMRPFTVGMWCTTGAFFIFTGFVIWLFEHRVNPEFSGKISEQMVTVLWFSFSTLFFAHREKLVSSLSRLVLVIWLFVVLILTSSYTASLTSILTVQQLNPIIKDVESLKARGEPIGYQNGSFVGEYLQEKFSIAKENLRTYSTPEEAGEALSKGPKNGGVAAIFDEIPYIRIFLASHCNNKMVGPVYRTGGLGFVFPKGSPLVSDISTAVLSLSEDEEMLGIQAKWFNGTACTDSEAKVDSNRLSMYSFWGLYLITGTVSLIALIIFFSMLIYDYMRDPNVQASYNSEMDDPSSGKSLKTLSRAVKSFMAYVDQKEGSTSGPRPRVSEISAGNTPFSTPAFTSARSDLGTSSFSSSTLSRRSFSTVDCEYVADADESTTEYVADADESTTDPTSSVSAPDQTTTEDIPPNTP